MALKMNEIEVISKVYQCIPLISVPLIVNNIPQNYLFSFLDFISTQIVQNLNIEFNMLWLKEILKYHN